MPLITLCIQKKRELLQKVNFNHLSCVKNVLLWQVCVNVWQMLSWQVKEICFHHFVLEFRVFHHPKSITYRVNKNGEVGEITQKLRCYSNIIFWRKKVNYLFASFHFRIIHFFSCYSGNFVVCNAIHSFIDFWLCTYIYILAYVSTFRVYSL